MKHFPLHLSKQPNSDSIPHSVMKHTNALLPTKTELNEEARLYSLKKANCLTDQLKVQNGSAINCTSCFNTFQRMCKQWDTNKNFNINLQWDTNKNFNINLQVLQKVLVRMAAVLRDVHSTSLTEHEFYHISCSSVS